MKIRPILRSLTVALLSAMTVVAIDGCTAAKKMSSPQPTSPTATTEETPKKEYEWKDMSTGKAFFGPSNKPALQ